MQKVKLGLALGSGAARGFAHIGVLKVLQKNNIVIDYVAGSSIGAIIGALFCSSAPLEYLEKLLSHLDSKFFIDLSGSTKGLISGKRIEELLKLFIRAKRFEDLKIPLSIVATDLKKGERVVFDKGEIITAVRASMSVPGIFTPVIYQDKMLVDGGLIDRVPSGVAKSMGADIVIGVDVGFRPGDDYHPKNMLDIIIQSIGIMEVQILKKKTAKCDVLLSPEVNHIKPFSIENFKESVEAGMRCAEENIDKIKMLIKEKSA